MRMEGNLVLCDEAHVVLALCSSMGYDQAFHSLLRDALGSVDDGKKGVVKSILDIAEDLHIARREEMEDGNDATVLRDVAFLLRRLAHRVHRERSGEDDLRLLHDVGEIRRSDN